MIKRAHVFVSGQVQGVFFRAAARRKAEELGVGGFARNLPDGRVEAAFEGDDDAVDAMVRWCHGGTSHAEVSSVDVTEEEPKGEREFEVA